MVGMSRRTRQVAGAIRDELVQITQRELNDPRISAVGMVTYSGIELSPDHRNATVYVSFMGEAKSSPKVKEALAALAHAGGFFRSALHKRLSMKVIPHLRFVYDPMFDRAATINVALREAADVEAQAAATKSAASGSETESGDDE